MVDRDVGGGDLYEGIVCVGRYDHQDEIGECEGLFHVGGQVMNFCESLFFDADEIPGRDIEEIAHPLVKRSLERFSALPAALKERVRFTHLNHTNPMCDPKSPQSLVVRERGFGIAQEGERLALLGNL